ncbi:MAG: type II secretion system F family protein [Armatimonadota bacterium]
MPQFNYRALDKAGATVSGVIQAESPEAGADRVRQLGLFPMAVTATAAVRDAGREAPRAAGERGKAVTGDLRRVGRMEIVLFTRQLADLVSAGLPLDRALTVLTRQTDSSGLRQRLLKVQEEVRAGRSLSEGLSAFPREFPRLYINMVRAGEATGQLGAVLERLAGYLEREATRRAQLISALTYPGVLIGVAFSAVGFLLAFVIPRLSTVFEELDRALPLPTQILLGLVGFLTGYWWQLLLGLALAVFAIRQAISTPAGGLAWDSGKLRVPIVGKLLNRVISARFVRSLGTMLAGGVPILDSLEIAREAVGNAAATRAADAVRESIRQGKSLAEALEESDQFLPVVVHMAAVGEETGRLPAMLIRTAESLDFEIDSQIRRLVTLIEPVIVLLMGAFVGFIVLSILLPIFEANVAVQ